MNISTRLQKIIETIEPCDTVADIGCDHGYVAISALQDGRARRAVAADVAKGPLDIARKNCEEEQVGDRLKLILSDGFASIPDTEDINCAVIAGMGGLLMERILRDGRLDRFTHLKQLVLSPQSDLDAVRRLLVDELSYTIRTEYMVLDEGKYYYIMDVRIPDKLGINGSSNGPKTKSNETYNNEAYNAATEDDILREQYTEAEYMFGKHIAAKSRDIYLDFLSHREKIVNEALSFASSSKSDSAKSKAAALSKELKLIEEAKANCISMQT